MTEPPAVPSDSRDWTIVITEGCAECAFTPPPHRRVSHVLRETVPAVQAALKRPDVRVRPAPLVWSPLEYVCHMRDLCVVFCRRLDAMVAEDGARFPDWDGAQAAVEKRYHAEDPRAVADAYERAVERLTRRFDAVRPDEWSLRGVRSDGYEFTLHTLGIYVAHDLVHHVHDIRPATP
jgi:hypothetical protein